MQKFLEISEEGVINAIKSEMGQVKRSNPAFMYLSKRLICATTPRYSITI